MAPKRGAASASSSVFDGLVFCVSGSFTRSQDALKALIVQHGGSTSSTVTASTDYLVCDSPGTGKFNEAERKGKPVVSEEWVDASIKKAALSTTKAHFLSQPSASKGAKASKAKAAPAASKGKTNKRKRGSKDEEDEEEEEEVKDEEVQDEDEEEGGADGGDERYLAGMVFAVSGAVPGYTQPEVRQLLIDRGATVASSITAAVTHVLAAATGSAKVQGAMSKGLPVLRPEWLEQCIAKGKLASVSDKNLSWSNGGGDDEGEEEEEEEEQKLPSPTKKKAKKQTKATKQADDGDDDGDAEDGEDDSAASLATSPTKLKTVVVKGRAPVDDCCPVAAQCHVIDDASGVYDAALNQTNIGNNNNKVRANNHAHRSSTAL